MTNNENKWLKLDNAGKIFPPTSTKRDPKVFRFSCELFEDINPTFLQLALDEALKLFPFFQAVLRRGLFWYYLEMSNLVPQIEKENLPPCDTLYHKNYKTLLFRVSYYKKRINLEIYHALADGTGALEFLKTIICNYLKLSHKHDFKNKQIQHTSTSSLSQKIDDSFLKYYKTNKSYKPPNIKKKSAYHFKGQRFLQNKIKVISGITSTSELLKISKSHNSTLSVFLTALYLSSFSECMSVHEKKKPVVVTLPVNLRNYFNSQTARNFFGIIRIGYDFANDDNNFESIIDAVKEQFARELKIEHIANRMNKISKVEHNVFAKISPLALKDVSLYCANEIARKKVSASFSNVGKITMPEEFEKYINRFDLFTSADRFQLCMCSFGDKTSISFTSPFLNVELQRIFFTKLSSMGLKIEISSNNI